jgi:hypothetical protein
MKFHQNIFKKNKDLFDITIHIFTFQKCLYFHDSLKYFVVCYKQRSPPGLLLFLFKAAFMKVL